MKREGWIPLSIPKEGIAVNKQKENIWNVPNLLTMLRMVLIPVYWVLFMQDRRIAALCVFAVASFTDLLDGRIARKYNLVTNFGKLFDPLADKLMVISVMLGFVIMGVIPWPIMAIVMAKEGTMLLGGTLLLKRGLVVYAEMIGKVAQVAMVTGLVLCFFEEQFTALGVPVHLIVLWLAVALTLAALVFYVRRGLQWFNESKEQ